MKIRLATPKDIKQIKKLQEKNHYKNLSEKEMKKEGFVSVETPLNLLKKIIDEGIFIYEINNKIIGYVMPLTLEHAKEIPLLFPFIDKFSKIKYKNKKILDYNWIIAGQICVDKEYKGKGIAKDLWKNFLKLMKKKYDLIVSEVSTSNPRSVHVCKTKLKMETIKTYQADGKEWYVVIYDLKK